MHLPCNCEGSVHTYHKIDMREFLEFVIRQLVEFPDDMVLTEIPSGKMTVFKVQLRQSDIGRVAIGQRARITGAGIAGALEGAVTWIGRDVARNSATFAR